MSWSALIPISTLDAANEAIGDAGFGYENFGLPTEAGTHAGFHAFESGPFRVAVEAIPSVVTRDANEAPREQFAALVLDHIGIKWPPAPDWMDSLPQIEDVREFDGVEWRNLMAGNPYVPPYGWKLVKEPVGVQPWVQPTGAQDAYPLGARVTYRGRTWENTGSSANVWEPGAPGITQWDEVDADGNPVAPPAPVSTKWTIGTTYAAGDEVAYQGASYRCRQGHTSNAAWTPAAVLSLWLPI